MAYGITSRDLLKSRPSNVSTGSTEADLDRKNISIKFKIRLQHALIFSIFMYTCETWTLTVELQRKITATEMGCYKRLLGISYTEHVTNDEVRRIS